MKILLHFFAKGFEKNNFYVNTKDEYHNVQIMKLSENFIILSMFDRNCNHLINIINYYLEEENLLGV